MDKDEIARLLTERGATRPCHRCGHKRFSVIDGYGNVMLQDDFNSGIVIGGSSVPVAYVGCNQCGAITAHGVGALGLIPQKEDDNEEASNEEGVNNG